MAGRDRNSIEVKLSSSRDYPRHRASRFAPSSPLQELIESRTMLHQPLAYRFGSEEW
jgi:hypothetical protein